jgi:hypothetical protein
LQAHQITSSQEHAKQDLNGLANLLPGKRLALHQRGSNLSTNTLVFVHSSVSSTGPFIKRDDAAVQAWIVPLLCKWSLEDNINTSKAIARFALVKFLLFFFFQLCLDERVDSNNNNRNACSNSSLIRNPITKHNN